MGHGQVAGARVLGLRGASLAGSRQQAAPLPTFPAAPLSLALMAIHAGEEAPAMGQMARACVTSPLDMCVCHRVSRSTRESFSITFNEEESGTRPEQDHVGGPNQQFLSSFQGPSLRNYLIHLWLGWVRHQLVKVMLA